MLGIHSVDTRQIELEIINRYTEFAIENMQGSGKRKDEHEHM